MSGCSLTGIDLKCIAMPSSKWRGSQLYYFHFLNCISFTFSNVFLLLSQLYFFYFSHLRYFHFINCIIFIFTVFSFTSKMLITSLILPFDCFPNLHLQYLISWYAGRGRQYLWKLPLHPYSHPVSLIMQSSKYGGFEGHFLTNRFLMIISLQSQFAFTASIDITINDVSS